MKPKLSNGIVKVVMSQLIDKEPLYNIGMKDLSDFVVLHDGRFWIDTECDDGAPPFDVGVPFKFTIDSVTQIGVVNCDDGVNEFEMIPFEVA